MPSYLAQEQAVAVLFSQSSLESDSAARKVNRFMGTARSIAQ